MSEPGHNSGAVPDAEVGGIAAGGLSVSSPTAPAGLPSGRGLSPQLRETARLYHAGWTVDRIAARLGVSEKTVRTYGNRVRAAGVALPRAPQRGGNARKVSYDTVCRLAREGLTQAEIGARVGCTQEAVSRILCLMRALGEPLPPGGRWPARRAGA